jgi:hypothetical protein
MHCCFCIVLYNTECLWEDTAAHPCVIAGLCTANSSSSTSNPTTSLLSATSSARHATHVARQRIVSCSRDGLLRVHALEHSVHRTAQRTAAAATVASLYSSTHSAAVTATTVTAKLVPLLSVPTGAAASCMCILDWPCSNSSSSSVTGSAYSSAKLSTAAVAAVAVVGCANGYWQAWSVTEHSGLPLAQQQQQQPLWSQRVHDAAVMSIDVLPQRCWHDDAGTCLNGTEILLSTAAMRSEY